MADLLTLNEYKTRTGIPTTETQYDAQITALLAAASLAIRNYADRSFETAAATEERQFEYDGSGFLDIDDATVITQVALSFTLGPDQVLDATYQWRAMPYGKPVFYYIAIADAYPWGISPELGFRSNLDMLAREGRLVAQLPVAKVTGTWGWPAIPEDVKMATVWTLEDWGAGPAGSTTPGVTAEAIEGFSRSFSGRAGNQVNALMGLTNRAKDLLAHYQKVYA